MEAIIFYWFAPIFVAAALFGIIFISGAVLAEFWLWFNGGLDD